jgi:hypothetical protein
MTRGGFATDRVAYGGGSSVILRRTRGGIGTPVTGTPSTIAAAGRRTTD